MWWTYFVFPSVDILHARREKSFWFGYLHMVVFASIVATRACMRRRTTSNTTPSWDRWRRRYPSSSRSVAYILSVCVVHWVMMQSIQLFHWALLVLTAALLGLAVLLAANGISMANCLLVVTLASVVFRGYELVGHRHAAAAIARNTRTKA